MEATSAAEASVATLLTTAVGVFGSNLLMNIGLLSFGAVPVLLSLYKYCQRKTILRPDNAYDFIVVGGNKISHCLSPSCPTIQ